MTSTLHVRTLKQKDSLESLNVSMYLIFLSVGFNHVQVIQKHHLLIKIESCKQSKLKNNHINKINIKSGIENFDKFSKTYQ